MTITTAFNLDGTGRKQPFYVLFVSRLLPTAFQAIVDQSVSRESVIYMVRLFHNRSRKPYYAPSRHRSMSQKLCRHVGMTVEFLGNPADMSLPEAGKIEADVDPYGAGHIIIHQWGDNLLPRIRSILRGFCLDRLETICLYLPFSSRPLRSSALCLRRMASFFAASSRAGPDWTGWCLNT